jgi:hypothetical protein
VDLFWFRSNDRADDFDRGKKGAVVGWSPVASTGQSKTTAAKIRAATVCRLLNQILVPLRNVMNGGRVSLTKRGLLVMCYSDATEPIAKHG